MNEILRVQAEKQEMRLLSHLKLQYLTKSRIRYFSDKIILVIIHVHLHRVIICI